MRSRATDFGSVIIITAVLVGACSAPEPAISWEGTVDTLPGGSVRVVNPPVGLWEAGIEAPWRLVPELTLGALEGDRPDVFSTIAGLAVDAEGRILVVDRGWRSEGSRKLRCARLSSVRERLRRPAEEELAPLRAA